MAFSAQTDHGQCERKDAVLCGIGQETSKRKAKVRFGPVTFHSALNIVFCIRFLYAKLGTKRLFAFGALAEA